MKALMIVAHGSRKPESNDEIRVLTEKVRSILTNYDLVDYAFLELAAPDIVQGGIKLIDAGATSIRVLPYFLVAGKHVVADVPAEVSKIAAQFPDVEVSTGPYLGSSDAIVDLLIKQVG